MDDLIQAFTVRFGHAPTILVRAPGRVNLIGEHTDYNDGLVLPAAINRHVRVAASARGDRRLRLFAARYRDLVEFDADAPRRASVPAWARYPQGVAVMLAERGVGLTGLDILIESDLPIGSGLSSSAALEVGCALILEHAAGVSLNPRERARLCHAAEVDFVGVPCGIMDQFATSLCRAGHALFLDCRTQETHHIPLPPEVILAVCDTGVRRTLGRSAYAARRQECATAVRWLRDHGKTAHTLRDLTADDLSIVEQMPDSLRRRVRHVVTENARVIETARALEGGDTGRLREIFLASHHSLRDDYEVSCPELDAMVASALDAPGCLAARMTGAGFGGAVVALVRRDRQSEFLDAVARGYRRRTDGEEVCFTSEAAAGAEGHSGWPA